MAKHQVLAEVGARIKLARERKRFTQAALGRRLGVSFQMVQRYERGLENYTVERLILIAKCLAVNPGWLMGGDSASDTKHRDSRLIVPGFYSRPARSSVVEADAYVKAACGLPADAPTDLAWENWFRRIHSDDHARVSAELARLEDPRDGVFDMRYRLVGRDGVERCIIDYGRMSFMDGRPFRLRGMMLDISHMPRTSNTEDRIKAIVAAVREKWGLVLFSCPQLVPGGFLDLPLPC